MTLAPWRSPLARALHLNRALVYARYAQLATIRQDGRPANRTVVFRGFWDETNQIKLIGDRRSDKIPQLAAQPWSELCWYFPKSREQFRLLGTLTVITADTPDSSLATARQAQWQALSDNARMQFAWPHPQAPRADITQFEPEPPDPTTPLPTFCLLLLNPTEVDHLALRGDPQTRDRYWLDAAQQWQWQAVNP